MEYNSQREELIIPEYGRHVQNLIGQAKEIENPKERQAFVEEIVNLILIMTPDNRTIENYVERVWKDVFRIADYDLEGVLPPSGQTPLKEDYKLKPQLVPYPVTERKFRHYGHTVQRMVEKAREMPEGGKRQAFTDVIASYMKLAYRTWNNEQFVTDEVIISDLNALSDGALTVTPNMPIEDIYIPQNRPQQGGKKSYQGSRQGQNRPKQNNKYGRQNKNRPKRK